MLSAEKVTMDSDACKVRCIIKPALILVIYHLTYYAGILYHVEHELQWTFPAVEGRPNLKLQFLR